MASVNKAIIIGHLGKDPELHVTKSGTAIANISVATSASWKDKDGKMQEQTEWHRITLFGRLGEIAEEYLKKGSQVYIEGRLQTRSWEDDEGNTRYTTEIVGHEMKMLGSKDDSGGKGKGGSSKSSGKSAGKQARTKPETVDLDDDIPF